MQSEILRVERRTDRLEAPACWRIESDNHQLILHESGSYRGLETWLDGRRTSLGAPLPGEFWLAPAGRCYAGAATGGTVHYLAITVSAVAVPLAARARALAGYHSAPMAGLASGALAGEDGADRALTQMLYDQIDASGAVVTSPAAVSRRIDDLLAFIEAHLDQPICIATMAAHTGMSVNSLLLHFARATGSTPAQYLVRQRLRRACASLIAANDSIASVAFASGFSSHAHLCATFREKLGMSPSEWRCQARQGAGS